MDVFDFTQLSVPEAIEKFYQTPTIERYYTENSFQETLINEKITDKFRVKKSTIKGSVAKTEGDFYIGIIVVGECSITIGDETIKLKKFDRFFCPSGVDVTTINTDSSVEILECYPPKVK